MHSAPDLRALETRILALPAPVLSVYLNTNPSLSENARKAYLLRLKDTIKEQKVPSKVSNPIMEYVGLERPRGRTLLAFASANEPPQTLWLQAELPEAVVWGEPYVAPLTLAIEEHAPVGLVLTDAHKLRLLVSGLQEVQEELDLVNPTSPVNWREMIVMPSSANPRGGAATDLFEHRMEEQIHHFYREAARRLRDAVKDLGLRCMILAGPEERIPELRRELPQELRRLVEAEVRLPAEISDSEAFAKVSQTMERLRKERERRLLEAVRESGVTGLEDTLDSLQAGALKRLVIPWIPAGRASWCDSCSLIAYPRARPGQPCPYCGSATRERLLVNSLIELSRNRDTEPVFLNGDRAQVLRDELGGLAGLRRF